MQTLIVIFVLILLLVVVFWLRKNKHQSTGGNAANSDPELESLYSLLGDNSGRMKK